MPRCLFTAAVLLWLISTSSCTPQPTGRSAEPLSDPAGQPGQAAAGDERPTSALRRACSYLWQQQSEDGGWHSRNYAVLRSGQALTPYVLHALLQVPEELAPRPQKGVQRALQFIRQNVDKRGALGTQDNDILEYPNYSTAFALLCLQQAGHTADRPLIERMRDYLLAEQFLQHRGFEPQHSAYGGWGFGGTHQPGVTGHMDLAHTRYVLEALQAVNGPPDAFQQAEHLLRLLQKHPRDPRPQPLPPETPPLEEPASGYDGGFYFSPVVLLANKGRLDHDQAGRPYWRSYATATCEGLLALLACGVPADDERVASAIKWLKDHPRLEYPEGIPQDHPEPWGDAVRFYHFAVRAQVYGRLDWPGGWRQQMTSEVASHQASDGSFTNRVSPLMKEDDPLLCTALALIAMTYASR